MTWSDSEKEFRHRAVCFIFSSLLFIFATRTNPSVLHRNACLSAYHQRYQLFLLVNPQK